MTWIQSLASLSGLRMSVALSCGVGCRCGLDPALLWLWCGPAATALIRPLAGESPYAAGAALEKQKDQNKQTNKQKPPQITDFTNKHWYRKPCFFCCCCCLFAFSRAAPSAYGGSQARGRIGAVAAGLRQSHSNAGSEPHLQPTPQLTATPDR